MRSVVFLLLLAACGSSRPPPPRNLPPPVLSTVVGPGDLFDVSVLGEKDLQREYRVQPDGTIVFPYVNRIRVAGLEPQQIEDLIRSQLISKGILSEAQVSVVVKQYNSKKVSVVGAVQRPGSLPWTEGLRLVDALSQSGYLTPLADPNAVYLTRKVGPDKTYTVRISVEAIAEGAQADVALQAGDTIKVDTRAW